MKQTTARTEKTLRLIFILIALFSLFSGNAQNVKQDANGNYIAVKKAKDSTQATATGKTYTDSNGNTLPVYVSKNGKLFVIRTSKNGNRYNFYLKP